MISLRLLATTDLRYADAGSARMLNFLIGFFFLSPFFLFLVWMMVALPPVPPVARMLGANLMDTGCLNGTKNFWRFVFVTPGGVVGTFASRSVIALTIL